MKTATVTAYIDTGFSGINVPDSPDILENGALKKQLDVINCLPLSGQVNVSIRVKAYDELHATDYIKMEFSGDGTTYWAKVNGYVYLSSDTVEISLTMDYWLTLGGIDNVSSISGITKRVHVAKADDQLFAFTEPDEMINPAKPLMIVCDDSEDYTMKTINPSTSSEDVIVLMSTLDLYAIGRLYETSVNDNGVKVENGLVVSQDYTYVDPETQQTMKSNERVTIPKLYSIGEVDYDYYDTVWGLDQDLTAWEYNTFKNHPYGYIKGWVPKPDSDPSDWDHGELKDLSIAGIGYFNANDEYVKKGVAILHDCGVEDALLDQYIIPAEYIDTSNTLYCYTNLCGRVYLETPHSSGGLIGCGLPYEYGTYQARNKKLFTGPCNAYTIYAKANSDMETFNPEVLTEGSAPLFRLCADLRHEGGAMMSPLSLNGDFKRWYMNFIKEMKFQSAPIKYQGASGSLINTASAVMAQNTIMRNFEQEFPLNGNTYNEGYDLIQSKYGSDASIAAGVLNIVSQNYGTGVSQIIGGALDKGLYDLKTDEYADLKEKRKATFYNKLAIEKINTNLKNTYVAPQLRFQPSQTLRELVGNGFLVFKYQLQESDLERCDKLLTMYGYRHSKTLEKTDLTNRPDFNYIEAGEVHITTSIVVPKWVREGAEDQLIGVRIWHKMFDSSCYEDNE